jgi:hypothetical protein
MIDLVKLDLIVASPTIVVPCPAGKEVRIVSIGGVVAGTEGNVAFLAFQRGGVSLMVVATNPMPASAVNIAAVVNGGLTTTRIDIIDPVTGVCSYEQGANVASMPLPDFWWPYEIRVNCSSVASAWTSGVLLYESRDRAK